MKKTLLAFTTIVALLFASCSNSAGSSNDDPAEETGNNTNIGLSSDNSNDTPKITDDNSNEKTLLYTLSFDANYPFATGVRKDENNNYVYNSTFLDSDGKEYYYMEGGTVADDCDEQASITSENCIVLEASPFTYSKWCYFNSKHKTSVFVAGYKFSHYNTNPDDTGTSYYEGDTITLTQDTTLYCFYTFWYDTKDDSNEPSNNTKSLTNKITGIWTITDSSYSGVLTLKPDNTGHLISYLGNTITHDFDFFWSVAYEESDSNTRLLLYFGKTTPHDNNEGYHHIRMNYDYTSMTFNEYLSFGMPYTTTWYKHH
ncbi:MAG: hypothetical protein K6C98_02665 [Treponema sp.]|nr:hypothetical protein [Treponema sp.]